MHVLWNVCAVLGMAVIAVFLSAGAYLCYVAVRTAARSALHPAPVPANVTLSELRLTSSVGMPTAHGDANHASNYEVN